MFMALTDYKPIYIRGPIYTGKTTVVKTMSIRLGRLLVIKIRIIYYIEAFWVLNKICAQFCS